MGGLKMKYCTKCKVSVRGSHETCPLCQRELVAHADTEKDACEEVFPYVPTAYKANYMMMKVINFISIAVIVVSVALNRLINVKHWWSLFVIAGVACFWISFMLLYLKHKNVSKTILYQVVTISGIAVVWDKLTGWHGWSFDFVVPMLCFIDLLVMFVLSKVMRNKEEDGLVYLLIGVIFGMIPLIFYLCGWLHIILPSIICVTTSILFFTATLIFHGDRIREELKRRLHY